MTLIAGVKMLLYGYTGQPDLLVATLIANRHRHGTESMIGLLVNTVILRTDLGGNPSGWQVLQRVRETTLAAYADQDLPFEDLVQTLERERGIKRASLCQVMVIFQNAMRQPLRRPGQTFSLLEDDPSVLEAPLMVTTFDVVLVLRDRPQGLIAECIYQDDLFDAATIVGLLADFQRALESLGTRPEERLSALRLLG
jgi:non-ribosomal peptide synthetase component F